MNSEPALHERLHAVVENLVGISGDGVNVVIGIHDVNTANDLRILLKMLDDAEAHKVGDVHWIEGSCHGVPFVVYHTPGLLIECAKAVPV